MHEGNDDQPHDGRHARKPHPDDLAPAPGLPRQMDGQSQEKRRHPVRLGYRREAAQQHERETRDGHRPEQARDRVFVLPKVEIRATRKAP